METVEQIPGNSRTRPMAPRGNSSPSRKPQTVPSLPIPVSSESQRCARNHGCVSPGSSRKVSGSESRNLPALVRGIFPFLLHSAAAKITSCPSPDAAAAIAPAEKIADSGCSKNSSMPEAHAAKSLLEPAAKRKKGILKFQWETGKL
jgi:hypothetical protein